MTVISSIKFLATGNFINGPRSIGLITLFLAILCCELGNPLCNETKTLLKQRAKVRELNFHSLEIKCFGMERKSFHASDVENSDKCNNGVNRTMGKTTTRNKNQPEVNGQ